MPIDTSTIQRFREIIAALDPEGPPRAEVIASPDALSDRCLVLDASFNPPTNAHLALATEGAAAVGAPSILLQLSSANVDKSVEGADLSQRLYMLEHLAQRDGRIGVAACSHARFLEKAQALIQAIPGVRSVFAIGYDTLVRLFDPVYYENLDKELDSLFEIAEFAVANRAEHDTAALDRFLATPIADRYRDKVTSITLDPSLASVSSSEIRQRIRTGQEYQHLVPDTLGPLIEKMGLYTE